MSINLTTKASPKVVERFKLGSCTEGIFSQDYEWTGVATVRVYSVDTLPLQQYDRTAVDGSSRFGTLSELGDTYQEMTVQDDISFNGTIDRGNNESQLMIKGASKVLRRQTDEVVIPYVDKFRLGKLATNGGSGSALGNTTLSDQNIVRQIMEANAVMSNNLVPDNNRVLYMGYSTAIDLKLASQVIGIDKLGEKSIVNGSMGKIDKCQVRLVPDDYLPAGLKFMIVYKGVALAPKKIQTFRILNDTHILDGAMVQGRLLHDCFVLNTKNKGIFRLYDDATSVTIAATASVTVGSTATLVPTTVPAGLKCTFASGTTSKVTVDPNTGVVTGVTGGTSTITVTCGTKTATCTVTAA